MTTFTNQKLYDLAVQNSIKLESVKIYEYQEKNEIFVKLRYDLGLLLNSIRVENMSYLTQREYKKLVATITKMHDVFYSSVSKDLIDMFNNFTSVKLKSAKQDITPIVIEHKNDYTIEEDGTVDIDNYIKELKNDGLFPYLALLSGTALAGLLMNKEISGVGYTFEDMLDKYKDSTLSKMVDPIRRGFATGFTLEEIKRELLGDSKIVNGYNGAVNSMQNGMNSIIDTTLGFLAANISAGVNSSVLTDKYVWISIMDSKTSDICMDRNRKIYEIGKGPLPPAHMRCRSSVAPYLKDNGSIDNDNFDTWINKQDKNIDKFIKNYGIINKDGSYKATKALKPNDLN